MYIDGPDALAEVMKPQEAGDFPVGPAGAEESSTIGCAQESPVWGPSSVQVANIWLTHPGSLWNLLVRDTSQPPVFGEVRAGQFCIQQ